MGSAVKRTISLPPELSELVDEWAREDNKSARAHSRRRTPIVTGDKAMLALGAYREVRISTLRAYVDPNVTGTVPTDRGQ